MRDGMVSAGQVRAGPTARSRRRLTRREVLRRAGGAVLAGGLLPVGAERVAARTGADQFANVELPPDLGQADLQVYVAVTGHTLRGSMLDYWRTTGATAVYGNPISEPFAAPNVYYSQAFENAVFQYRSEYLYTADPIMRLLPIGEIALRERIEPVRVDGRRGAGGGDRRARAWRPLDPASGTAARIVDDGGLFVEATGHTIGADVLPWYTMNEGQFYLGAPLGQPLRERGMTVQYFEGGLLITGRKGTYLAPLAAELAPRLDIDTTPVSQGDLPFYDESLFWTGDNPNPIGDPAAPGMRWIEVSIGEQRLWAYQGDTPIMTTLISTGIEPNGTELGLFHVRLKYVQQDMRGFTNSTGEVLGFGDAPPGTVPYEVKAIPHVMYFNLDAEALHGAYWHNNFGQKMSHGCVNLPLDVAAFLFGWAPLGTQVWVHE